MTTRPFQHTIPLEEAFAIIERHVAPITRAERIPLQQANGRVLAGDIVAGADVPPFARAAMDGYAVRADDTIGAGRTASRTLRCIEQVFTGQVPVRAVGPGQCIEVATGAPLPTGADAVVMVEEADDDGSGEVRIFAAARPGQNIGRQGADI